MDNESLMAPENPRSEIDWSVLRTLQGTLSVLLLVVCLFIYAATDLGGYNAAAASERSPKFF